MDTVCHKVLCSPVPFRGQRQGEQELSDTREQVVDLQNSNASLTNAKRKLDSDIHQIQVRVGSS